MQDSDNSPSAVDRDAAIKTRLLRLNRVMRAHAGGVELVEVSAEGVVTLRFTGMCSGCFLRPLTSTVTVRPTLLSVRGVTGVKLAGANMSAEAEERVMQYLGPSYRPLGSAIYLESDQE